MTVYTSACGWCWMFECVVVDVYVGMYVCSYLCAALVQVLASVEHPTSMDPSYSGRKASFVVQYFKRQNLVKQIARALSRASQGCHASRLCLQRWINQPIFMYIVCLSIYSGTRIFPTGWEFQSVQ